MVNRGLSPPHLVPPGGLVSVHGSSPRWVSFPLEKLQATGYSPRQREEAADAHPVLALTWSEDAATRHRPTEKLFFLISKLRTKYLV